MQPLAEDQCASSGLEQQKENWVYEATDSLKDLGDTWVINSNLLVDILTASTRISGK